ncbi:short chain dehydrogenase [Streptomyces sp. NBRC 110028]|uniref:short chain dehydrogenase n=1 Tax=Streptomyces sp. NBRC 110028 TaxID=1621260 RepID=UPI0007C75AED
MKIIVIGATGTIGRTVADALEPEHEVIRASRNGSTRVDLEIPDSIDTLFDAVGEVDAVICCAASGQLTPLTSPSDDEFTLGLKGKLLGQVMLLRRALDHVRDGGSITLTSGTFEEPTPGSSFGALVNAGLEAFVQAAAIELPRGLRVNVISPGWVRETLEKLGMDSEGGTPLSDVVHAYLKAVTGSMRGQTLTPSPRRQPECRQSKMTALPGIARDPGCEGFQGLKDLGVGHVAAPLFPVSDDHHLW